MKVFETIHTFCDIAVAIQDNTFVQVVTIDGQEKINCLKAEIFAPNYFDDSDPLNGMQWSLLSAWTTHLLALGKRIDTLRDTNIMPDDFVNALDEYRNQNFEEITNASKVFNN
jgi:hypothetical protein